MWKKLQHPHVQPFLGLHWSATGIPGLVSPWHTNGDMHHYLKAQRNLSHNLIGVKLELVGFVYVTVRDLA